MVVPEVPITWYELPDGKNPTFIKRSFGDVLILQADSIEPLQESYRTILLRQRDFFFLPWTRLMCQIIASDPSLSDRVVNLVEILTKFAETQGWSNGALFGVCNEPNYQQDVSGDFFRYINVGLGYSKLPGTKPLLFNPTPGTESPLKPEVVTSRKLPLVVEVTSPPPQEPVYRRSRYQRTWVI